MNGNITRAYIAKWADKNGFVQRVASREQVSPTMFQEPNSDMESINKGIKAYYQALDNEMDKLELSPYQRTAFLAAEAIGMNLAQEISFVAGNLAIDQGNRSAYGVEDGTAYVVINHSTYHDRLEQVIKRARLSDSVFTQEFQDGIFSKAFVAPQEFRKFGLFDKVWVEVNPTNPEERRPLEIRMSVPK